MAIGVGVEAVGVGIAEVGHLGLCHRVEAADREEIDYRDAPDVTSFFYCIDIVADVESQPVRVRFIWLDVLGAEGGICPVDGCEHHNLLLGILYLFG